MVGSTAIGPTLAGHISDISDSYITVFLSGAIAMVLAAVCFYLLKVPKAVTKEKT